jgi:hypothetical protein
MTYQSMVPPSAESRLYGDLAWLWPTLSAMGYVHRIRERGRLRIAPARHLPCIFDLPTWRRLLTAAG